MWNSLSFGAWPYRIGQQIDPKFEMETLNDFRGLMIQNVLGRNLQLPVANLINTLRS